MTDDRDFMPHTFSDPEEIDIFAAVLFTAHFNSPSKRHAKKQKASDWGVYADWLEDHNQPLRAAFIRKYHRVADDIVAAILSHERITKRLSNGWRLVVQNMGSTTMVDLELSLCLPRAKLPVYTVKVGYAVTDHLREIARMLAYAEGPLKSTFEEVQQ